MNIETYQVFNRTRNACLADAAESARTLFQRMKGLIGRPARLFPAGKGLWIIPSDGIHTFGMRFPIDAVYLDSSGKVLRLYHSLPPCRIGAIILKTRSVLELPPGILAKTHTEAGDVLEFYPTDSRA